MTVSSLSASPYATQPLSLSSSSSSASGSAVTAESLGQQLLSAIEQSQAGGGATSDPLLQELVTLSPAALGQKVTGAPQTYNAKGFLQQVQSNMMLNDPLLQSDATATGAPLLQSNFAATNNATGNSLLQNLTSSPQVTSSPTQTTQPVASTANNLNLAQLLTKDPSLAGALVESQIDQGAIAMLG